MESHNPARRRLLGGLLAGLFAWLLPRKSQAKPPQPTKAYTTTLCTVSYSYYNVQGQLIASSGKLTRQAPTEFTYDSQNRATSSMDF